jgi:hypothetical protein
MTAATTLLFQPDPVPVVPIVDEARGYPVSRIFCVGRNYAEHAKEMGSEVDREVPWYFTKPRQRNRAVGNDYRLSTGDEELPLRNGVGRRDRRAGFPCQCRRRTGSRVWLCVRPGHDATRSANCVPGEIAPLGSRQGVRELRRDLGPHAGSEISADRPAANLAKGWRFDQARRSLG